MCFCFSKSKTKPSSTILLRSSVLEVDESTRVLPGLGDGAGCRFEDDCEGEKKPVRDARFRNMVRVVFKVVLL